MDSKSSNKAQSTEVRARKAKSLSIQLDIHKNKHLKKKLSPKLTQDKSEEPVAKKAHKLFQNDSDSEPEDMPKEAKMRMKNVGEKTPTSAGPNSFCKGKRGFEDPKKRIQSSLVQLTAKLDQEEGVYR